MPDTFPFSLPSGRAVEMRYPDLYEIIFDETIPDPVTALVEALISQTQNAYGMATAEQMNAADATLQESVGDTSIRFVQLIVERSVVNPRIVTSAKEGREFKAAGVNVLHIAQLTAPDILAIFYKARGASDALAALFRGEAGAGESVASVSDVPEDASPGVEPVEHTSEPALVGVHDG